MQKVTKTAIAKFYESISFVVAELSYGESPLGRSPSQPGFLRLLPQEKEGLDRSFRG